MRIKVALVGPKNSGKTCISNMLSKYREILPSSYQPTMGCRIVEWEVESADVVVEIWDCSGDITYQHCWPAMEKDLHGVWIVINPGFESSIELYSKFFTSHLASQEHCWIVYHSKTLPMQKVTSKLSLPNTLFFLYIVFLIFVVVAKGTPLQWKWIESNLDTSVNQEALRREFDQFLQHIIKK